VHAARQSAPAPLPPAAARWLGRVEYEPTWRAMQRWVESHQVDTPDELWLLEHPPVFTLGQSARREHLLAPGEIPVVAADRGGQVTYHGPGQLVVYVLLDLNRLGLGVRALVMALEAAVIGLVAERGIRAHARRDAPGVYVGAAKLASIGLRIRRGISYHGLALNVDMDLDPFSRINPCGQAGLETVDLRRLGCEATVSAAGQALVPHLWRALSLAGEPRLAI
jgi:lipoyl(octanoyl) transferase